MENLECRRKTTFTIEPNTLAMRDTYRTRVYQSKVGRCTRYLERKTLRTMEYKYGQRDREDDAGHYGESFVRENYDYMKFRHYERIICLNEERLYG